MKEFSGEITQFLDELGKFASRDLPYKSDVGVLLHRAKETKDIKRFEDLIFLAKFVSRTFEVMRRIGPDAEGYDKLAAEFSENLQKATALARALVQDAPASERERFENSYFGLEQESFRRLLGLLGDLSWVKNWLLDGKPLP
jgi:hypothetical protein